MAFNIQILSFLLFLLLLPLLLANEIQPQDSRLTVSPTSPYCKQVDNSFDCNFQNIDKTVFLDNVPNARTTKIFLHNARRLTVSPKVCVNLAFFSVSDATFALRHECPPGTKTSLKLVQSGANLIPHHVIRIEMEDSSVEVLDSKSELEALSLVRSNVGRLNVPGAIHSSAPVRIEHSTIVTLEELELENSHLLMLNTTVGSIRKHALQLRASATGSLWISRFKETIDQAVVLGPKSTLTLKDVEGKVTIVGDHESSSDHPPLPPPTTTSMPQRSAPGVPPKNRIKGIPSTSCPQQSSIFWLLPSALALVEAMIIIVNCTSWFPALKGRRVGRGVEEGGRRNPNSLESVGTSGYNDSTFYYSSDSSGFQNTTIRGRRDKVA